MQKKKTDRTFSQTGSDVTYAEQGTYPDRKRCRTYCGVWARGESLVKNQTQKKGTEKQRQDLHLVPELQAIMIIRKS